VCARRWSGSGQSRLSAVTQISLQRLGNKAVVLLLHLRVFVVVTFMNSICTKKLRSWNGKMRRYVECLQPSQAGRLEAGARGPEASGRFQIKLLRNNNSDQK